VGARRDEGNGLVPTWQVRLVDEVEVGAGPSVLDLNSLRPPQARLLLSHQVLERHRPVPREEAAALLWEGSPPLNWEAALRVLVGRARNFLGGHGADPGALRTAGRCHRLRLPGVVRVDVEEARDRLREASALVADSRSAAELRDGLTQAEYARQVFELPLLPGLSGRWWQDRCEEHREHLTDTLALISEIHGRLGDHDVAVSVARRAWERQPLRERALRILMVAHQRAGNRAAAIDAYHVGRRRLHDSLGIDPDTQTQQLFLTLLHGSGAGD
jgi:SARP family transcriptional regulator, regulator of embCAB operon